MLSVFSPWRQLNRLQQELYDVFNDWSRPWPATRFDGPALNYWTDDRSAVLQLFAPGFETDSFHIDVDRDVVTVRGRRPEPQLPDGAKLHRQEQPAHEFERRIQLDFTPDREKTEAVYKNGVLEIRLYKPEHEQPKRIAVKSA